MAFDTKDFLTDMGRALCHGRLSDLTDAFVYPLPLYWVNGLVVFGAPVTLAEALALYRAAFRAAGVHDIVPRVVADGMRLRGYANLWVELDHLDGTGTCLRTSQVRYVTHQPDTGLPPRIELVDYTRPAFPEIEADLAVTPPPD